MHLHVVGNTGDGSLVLFWPEFWDEKSADDWKSSEDVQYETTVFLLDSQRPRGDYHLGLFVDEHAPDRLQKHCHLVSKVESLEASETGYFGGAEWLFEEYRAATKRPGCGEVRIPPGKYSAELFRTSIPDEVYEQWLRDEAGASAQRWWWVQTWFAATGVVAAMVLVAAMFIGTREFMTGAAIVAGVLLAVASLMSLTPGYQRIQQARREYTAAYPDFVVCLRTIALSPESAVPRPNAE